ncbi:MAG: hypothetical protein NXH91_17865 [Phyllobacteriaceae bacterium]|nr:hypothetical protein [Phyllobacteriaceae bacterium]
MRAAEAAVADFRAANGLFVGQNNSVLATQQLAELSTELSRVRAERSALEARVRSVESALEGGSSVDTLPDVIASPVVARLTEQQANLKARQADLSTTLLPGHPRMQALQSQIGGLDAQIRDQARNVLAGLRNEARIARGREDELNGDLNTLKAASAEAGDSEVELRALEREAASKRALLETYLLRYREAQSRDQGEYAPAKARVISRATVALEPSFPRMVPMVGATFFAALLLMLVITLMRELFSGRALVPAATASATTAAAADQPAPRRTSLAVAAPTAPIAPIVPAAAEAPVETPPANDNFSVAAVTAKLVRRGAGRALIVSPMGGSASHNTVAIARALDAKGLRAIVMDLSGTGLAGGLMDADPADPGITDLLAAEASYSDVIFGDGASGAHIIADGNADADRALSGIERLPIILDGLSSAYDVVLVDCGATDAAGLGRLVSADSEIVLSVDGQSGESAVDAARDLADGGFDDVLIVIEEEGQMPDPVEPEPLRKAG